MEPLYEQDLFRLEHLSSLFCLEVKFIFSSHILNVCTCVRELHEAKILAAEFYPWVQ